MLKKNSSYFVIRIGEYMLDVIIQMAITYAYIYDHFLIMTTLYTKENASKLLFYTPYNEVFHIINPITNSVVFASGLINDDGNNQEIHYS